MRTDEPYHGLACAKRLVLQKARMTKIPTIFGLRRVVEEPRRSETKAPKGGIPYALPGNTSIVARV